MKKTPNPIDQTDDFKNLVNLLSVYAEAEARLGRMEAVANQETIGLIDEFKDEYAELQKALTESESAMEVIARKHPEWFTTKATLKTPYGSVALKNNPPKLVVKNEEVSVLLIQQGALPAIREKLLRSRTELNLESLSALTDEELAKYRIERVQGDTFSVKAAKLDLGKAVKEAAEVKEAA